MATLRSLLCVCAALSCAALAAGCADQQGGAAAKGAIQDAVNAFGAGLGGKPAGAATPAGDASASGGKVVVINGMLIAVDGDHPSDPRWAGKQIKDTPLFHFFQLHPTRRPGDYFPRVAVRIDDYSPSLVTDSGITKHLSMTPGATPRLLECMKFTVMVWMSEKQSQRIDNVALCSSDIRSNSDHLSLGALRNYAGSGYAPISISSGQTRTLGPREPEKLLPNFTSDDIALYGHGQHLFSELFTQMAFQGPIDGDQRLWFVNLASAAK